MTGKSTGPSVAVLTVAHGRHDHLLRQQGGLGGQHRSHYIVVAMGDPDIPRLRFEHGPRPFVVPVSVAGGLLPLARARNLAANTAIERGADLLIFLDVDVIPGPDLCRSYQVALGAHPDVIWSGPVTYLDPPPPGGYPPASQLTAYDKPHPARPAPNPGDLLRPAAPDLFWSLSFAVHKDVWASVGGFCEEYVGYGAEDTDFARLAVTAGHEFGWCGGARAFHQYHPVSSPPVEHVGDIVANAQLFHDRWGEWPMERWLDEFESTGLIWRTDNRVGLRDTPGEPL